MRQVIGLMAGFVMVALLLPARAQDTAGPSTSWLLVMQGEVTAIEAGMMTLAVAPRIVAFTDRPERRTALLDLETEVARLWGEGGDFVASPPNASLIDESKGLIGVVEITGAAAENGQLRLEFVSLEGTLPAVGDAVALTIDMERDDIIEY